MEWWRVGLALGLPWLAGVLWLRALWRDAPAGIWPMALGYGGVLGLLAVTLLLRVQAAVGLPLNFAGPIVVLTLLVLAGVAVPYGVLAGRQDWSVTGFWVAFALAVVAVILRGIRGWRDV